MDVKVLFIRIALDHEERFGVKEIWGQKRFGVKA
jgi:hypothetical protein